MHGWETPQEPGAFRRGAPARWLAAALVLGGFAALLMLYLQRPQGQVYYPLCSFHAATGLLCPGCGGLRATHELLHGRVLDAIRANALLVLGLPAAVGWWWAKSRRPSGALLSSRTVWILFALTVAYTVTRNLPWAPFRWLVP